jgi:hypothetical protein
MPLPVEEINLREIEEGIPALSPAFGAFLGEACRLCLYQADHLPGKSLEVLGEAERHFRLIWEGAITPEMLRAWKDAQESVEYGATCLAILLVLRLTPYTVIERSVKGTGFDYWLGERASPLPFQQAARLEISGMAEGGGKKLQARAESKLAQTRRSAKTGLPAVAIVVEFRKLRAYYLKA